MKLVRHLPNKYFALFFICTCLGVSAGPAWADEGETDVSAADASQESARSENNAAASVESEGEPAKVTVPVPAAGPAKKSVDGTAEEPETANAAQSEEATQSADTATTATDSKTQSEPYSVPEPEPAPPEPFVMLNSEVPPGETRRLAWIASESFSGISVPTPVLVSHGTKTGPTLCLTAAIHGDELNGIEMVRRVLYGLDPQKLSGTVVGVPIVNLFGFRRSSRYLPDRRDLNRYFPGDPRGSSASRIAHSFFEEIIKKCDYLVDLHTGSFHRTNLPQLRADLSNPEVLKLTQGFGATAALSNNGQVGTLRRAATDTGIPAVTLEAGEPTRFQPDEVAHGVKGIHTLLNKLGMLKRVSLWGDPQPIYYASDWVRADTGGILFSRVNLGDEVEKNQILGTVTDPITNNRSEIRAPQSGRILSMALNQVVIPGFASFRIGIEKTTDEVVKDTVDAPDETQTQEKPKAQSDESAGDESDTPIPVPEKDLADSDGVEGKDTPPKASKDGVEEERPD